ncbi:DegT/DnrJ/EryC1/StrS family aminotransferase [Gammaproteobacteria bacterium]|nr:DegT/DnrJ/EryC1/StrS family aminotransferase [Gammaproteobacteria bacterium]
MSSSTAKDQRHEIPQREPSFGDEEARAIADYMKTGAWITEYQYTDVFERRFSSFLGVSHSVATTSGTAGLVLALVVAGVRPGDKVIVPNFTMIASATAVSMIGAQPVFVDIEPHTLFMDLEQLNKKLDEGVKAVIVVDINGRCGDIDGITEICARRGVFVIEDAAQALGSRHGSRNCGTLGDIGAFSLSSQKIISTGQGGVVVTDDDSLAARVRRLKDFGRPMNGADTHEIIGFNFKITDLQAIIGIEQMRKITDRISHRKACHQQYESQLAGVSGIDMLATDLRSVTPWMTDIYLDCADDLKNYMNAQGIGSRRVHPSINKQMAYDIDESFPVSESVSRRGLWLPSSSTLTESDIEQVCSVITKFMKH